MAPTGRPRKPPERRQHKASERTKVVALSPTIRGAIPKPPDGLLKTTVAVWRAYWSDDVSRIATDSDSHAMRRLILYIDEWERCIRGFREERWIVGSTGQPRLNPMGDQALKLEQAITRLATELGLTPYARMKLGIAVGQATKTLEDLKRDAERDDDDNDSIIEHDDDPRLTAVDITTQDGDRGTAAK